MRDILHVIARSQNKTVLEILHLANTTQNKQYARCYTLQKEHRKCSVRDTTRYKRNTEHTVREILHVTNRTQVIQCAIEILHVTNRTSNKQRERYYTKQIEPRTYSA